MGCDTGESPGAPRMSFIEGHEPMKYENINSAMHEFGRSYLSLMNCVDGVYVLDDLFDIRKKGYDIEIDWLNDRFTPESEATGPIRRSMADWRADLERHLASRDVDIDNVRGLKLVFPARGVCFMWAVDDRGREYRIYIY